LACCYPPFIATPFLIIKEAGSYDITVTVDDVGGASTFASGPVTVLAQTLEGWGQTYETSQQEGTLTNQLVATFIDPGGCTDINDYSAEVTLSAINDDSVPSSVVASTITYNAQNHEFYVTVPSCTLYYSGNDSGAPSTSGDLFSVKVNNQVIGGTTVSGNVTAPVTTLFDGDPLHVTVVESQQATAVLAQITTTDPTVTTDSFSVEIGLEDPAELSCDLSVVSIGGGVFLVVGTYSFSDVPLDVTDAWGVLRIDFANGRGDTVYPTFSVTDAAVTLLPVTGLTTTENTPLVPPPTATTVATFTSDAPADDFLAQITWEDGHTSTGTIAYDATAQQYTISGDYTYEEPDSYPVTVQLFNNADYQHPGGSNRSPDPTTTIQVNDAALTASAVELPLDNAA
jgi:hypothetical protein